MNDSDNPQIPTLAHTVTMMVSVMGLSAIALYYRAGLTLSHYDAKAHLVVARRILDSLSPGWRQIGAVWLPLPHLLNVVPVQADVLYRSGLSAVALSFAGFVLGATSLWKLVARVTRCRLAAWTSVAIFASQPDVLYLQATPMTEGLLIGLCLAAIERTPHGWIPVETGRRGRQARRWHWPV
jgi:hypothetical protein